MNKLHASKIHTDTQVKWVLSKYRSTSKCSVQLVSTTFFTLKPKIIFAQKKDFEVKSTIVSADCNYINIVQIFTMSRK